MHVYPLSYTTLVCLVGAVLLGVLGAVLLGVAGFFIIHLLISFSMSWACPALPRNLESWIHVGGDG